MKESLGYKNDMAVPKIEKAVVNIGTGSIKDDAQKEFIEKQLSMITGQKPVKTLARKSIATFKIREGGHIGYSVTLRGNRMYEFLNKMLFVAIPRKRDFRGIDTKSVDQAGNLTIGFKENIVFPEMVGEDIRNTFGLEVSVVTNAETRKEAIELFKLLNFPFKKEVEK
jgi:large subunit ribosomal protein L5